MIPTSFLFYINRFSREPKNTKLKSMDERLKKHFLSLYCMVVADQDISPTELVELYRIGKEHYNLTDIEINNAILSEGTACYIPEKIEEKIIYLYELALIACADDTIKTEERILLEKYALMFGFERGIVQEKVNYLSENFNIKTTDVQ